MYVYVYIHTSAGATPLTHLPLDHLSLPLFFFSDPATALPITTHSYCTVLNCPSPPIFFLLCYPKPPIFFLLRYPKLPITAHFFSYCTLPNCPFFLTAQSQTTHHRPFFLPAQSQTAHRCPFFLTALSQSTHHHPFFLTALSQTAHHCPFFLTAQSQTTHHCPFFSYCTIPNCPFLPIFLTAVPNRLSPPILFFLLRFL